MLLRSVNEARCHEEFEADGRGEQSSDHELSLHGCRLGQPKKTEYQYTDSCQEQCQSDAFTQSSLSN